MNDEIRRIAQKSGKFQARKKELGDFTFLTPWHSV